MNQLNEVNHEIIDRQNYLSKAITQQFGKLGNTVNIILNLQKLLHDWKRRNNI